MARCEDFPCCGHENGCCPDFDSAGRQLNMRCTCGATVPLGSRSSICESCLRADDDESRFEDGDCPEFDDGEYDDNEFDDRDDRDDERDDREPDESMDGDFDSGMASAGHGTDEDYGDYGQDYDGGWDGDCE